jgi:biopolymer transport protein ExbB/TolQ
MDEEALKELPKIEKRTGYLAMLGNLATLAGLLGTITGLIKSFSGVAGVGRRRCSPKVSPRR